MLRVGIIGLGVVGKRLFEQFNLHPQTKITAICDVNETLLQQAKSTCPNASLYKDYQQLLLDEEIDLVYIAVPPALHYQIAIDAFANEKHVLCEKPLANSLAEAKKMAEAVKESGLVHAIHFPLVYSPQVALFQQKVQAGLLGDLRRVELKMHFHTWPRPWQETPWIARREQGGFIREITPHYIQLIQMLFGNIETVESNIEFPANEVESEVGLIAKMALATGQPVLVDGLANIAQEEKISFTAYGTKGTISLEDWRILKVGGQGERLQELTEINTTAPNMIDALVSSIASGNSDQLVDFEKGYFVQQILEQLRHPSS